MNWCDLTSLDDPNPVRLTHRRVFDAAGEGNSTALPAGVEVSAVEVDVQVPVVGPVGSAAGPLAGRRQEGGREGGIKEARPVSRQIYSP